MFFYCVLVYVTKIDEEQFVKLDLKDLSETLGIKYFSDRRKLIGECSLMIIVLPNIKNDCRFMIMIFKLTPFMLIIFKMHRRS